MRSLMWGPTSADGIAPKVAHAQTRPSTKHENNGIAVRNIPLWFYVNSVASNSISVEVPLSPDWYGSKGDVLNWRCAGIQVTWGKATSGPRFAYFKVYSFIII